ncbi:MAG: 1-deoxy-D-xylulose-5-phosphate synthase [Chloroflexi bacterium]|nr:1-deoxy-D-xylulose-5-phosphate synthase [Chloroflexota bacterium]
MSTILDQVNKPSDLKKFDYNELTQLASEIRAVMVSTITVNGGHLASSLGAVELTIALHRVFNSPVDKIVWDVGHQTYAHKLLTGRKDLFSTIRNYGGLSGFIDPLESPYDAFISGHASNSISAAIGLATARKLSGENYNVIAVIGDGSLGGGMAFEALNYAGHNHEKLIVVLNDNAMSISPSIGAMAHFLSKLRFNRGYRKAKKEAGQIFSRLFGQTRTYLLATRVMTGIKGFLLPSMLWEDLGFLYLGPVNGHNIADVEQAFLRARMYDDKPVLIHVITRKGNGYKLAEDDPVGFHGITPSQGKSSKVTYTQIFSKTMHKVFEENPKVVAITAAMLQGTGLEQLQKTYPGRVFDVGICEQHAVTMAAGLAKQGFIPVVAIYSTFLQRAFDQIIHDVCLQDLPVIFAIDRSGIVGEDGKTHQGNFDLSYLNCIPNMIVCAPGNENELQHLLYTATKVKHPIAIRYPRGFGIGIELDEDLKVLPIGKSELIEDGSDLCIVALGAMVGPSVEAVKILKRDGISCAIINARFAKPLDEQLLLKYAQKTKQIITVEENLLAGGFGSAVLSFLHESNIDNLKIRRIGLPDKFIEHGPQSLLRSKYGLSGEGIANLVRSSQSELILTDLV